MTAPVREAEPLVADPADDLALIEMANLPAEKTGVPGVIYISTAQGSHSPRAKWYPGRPYARAPCLSVTIEAQPKAFNHHLPQRAFDAAVGPVSVWVALNHAALLDFWNDGNSWLDDEVTAFKASLKRLE